MERNDDVGVVVGTFGDPDWLNVARTVAVPSINEQTIHPAYIYRHGNTLQEARNEGAQLLIKMYHVKYLIFLDADDELEPTYVEEMLKGTADIRRPSTRGIYEDGSIEDPPSMIPERDLRTANYIIIGSMCRADQFTAVGGFDDYPILEDWALWRKLVKAGATIENIPEAVYRIHVHPGSRNMHEMHNEVYLKILQDIPL